MKIINKKILVIPGILFFIFSATQYFGVMINTSSSMPLGFYIKNNLKINRGDIVAFCLQSSYAKIGLQHHYLKYGFKCDGARSLIKQVIAMPGDNVQLADEYISVNNKLYFYKTFHLDRQGRHLASFPRGTYFSKNEYWLIGVNDPHSWDSRYWGPVQRQQIISRLTPLFIW
jgi:conjugative transfer signal peptidase TraF